jgi:hypothetical protein
MSKQNSLYRKLAEKEPEIAESALRETDVKSEMNEEFIDCNQDHEDFLQPQCVIKLEQSEADDNEFPNELFEESFDAPSSWSREFKVRLRACSICGFKTKSRKLLAEHENSHVIDTGTKHFFCDICSHGTFFKTEMEDHMKGHAKRELQNFYCEFCSKQYDKRHLLNRHIKLKHTAKERQHLCPTCNKSFFTISTLKKHVESHREKDMPCMYS